MEIADRVALVTGGASGIGLAAAECLVKAGARVVIADVNVGAGERAASELGASFVQLDVSDAAAWEQATAGIVAEHGSLDIAVLNAGLLTPNRGERRGIIAEFDIAELQDEDYRLVTSVNIDGVVFGARAAVRAMAGHDGALVATASASSIIPYPPDPIYAMTKHAVVGFVRSLAPTLVARNITFNSVCPAVVRTDINADSEFDMLRDLGVPIMAPAEIGEAILGGVTSGATGQTLVCMPTQPPRDFPFLPLDLSGTT